MTVSHFRPPGNEIERAMSQEKLMDKVTIALTLTDDGANGLAQLIKRLDRRSLGKDDLNLVTPAEADPAEAAIIFLREALAEAGYAPR